MFVEEIFVLAFSRQKIKKIMVKYKQNGREIFWFAYYWNKPNYCI